MISSVVVSMGTSLRCSHSYGSVLNADHGGKFRDHEFGMKSARKLDAAELTDVEHRELTRARG